MAIQVSWLSFEAPAGTNTITSAVGTIDAGASSTTAVGRSVVAQAASAAGTALVLGTGRALRPIVGSSGGSSTVAAVGRRVAASSGTIAGVATATGASAMTQVFGAAGSSAGQAQASGAGGHTAANSQRLRPSDDVATGTWAASSGSNRWDMIDEASPSDLDYISTSTPDDAVEFALTDWNGDLESGNHLIRYRARHTGGLAALLVQLVQGATVIATRYDEDLAGDYVTRGFALTPEEVALITDPTDLRLRFTSLGSGLFEAEDGELMEMEDGTYLELE